MNNSPIVPQPVHTLHTSQQSALPPGQPLPQPAQPSSSDVWVVAQDLESQQSHVQNPQWMDPQPPRPPPPDQSALYTNCDHGHGLQRQRQQPQCRQDQNCAPPPVAQHVASPQPQLPYYPQLQPQQQQQQKRLPRSPPQDLMPAKRRRFDGQDLNRQAQHQAPSQQQFQPFPPLAQNTEVYPGQNQASGPGGGSGLNNAQLDANKEDEDENHGGMRTSMQAGECDPTLKIAEPTIVPATQLKGAQGFTISGNSIWTNIGINKGVNNLTTVNNYGGTHGLEGLKDSVSFPALHNSSAQDPDRRCHPGTRENVLSRLRHCIDNLDATAHRIFWLYGPAGAGKSAIAQTIAHEYIKGEVAATFFFYRSDAMRNDGNRLFPTIAWQLAFCIPSTKEFIVQALDKIPHLPTSDVETQFEHLVAQIFRPTNNIASQMPHPAPVVIIDGIDECLDERLQRRILTVIGNAVKECRVPLRVLISSRRESLIEDALNQFQDFILRIDLATLDDSNRDAEKYLVDKFSVVASKQGLEPSWPGQETIQEFVSQSSGYFIFASAVMRYISDEDYSAVSQLDIVRNLKPRGTALPFALLDELYLEVLKQPRDQDFLKTFLALLVGCSSVKGCKLYDDYASLMNVSEKELHIKLRRMRSLLEFEPFIDVYHTSFIDFLQDSSRSGPYHLFDISLSSNCHETCRSIIQSQLVLSRYPPEIVLPVEDWQEALKPLLDLQDKLLKNLNTSKLQPCHVTQIMRDLLLHLAILQRISHHAAAAPVPESNMHEAVTEWSPVMVTEAMQNIPDNDLDSCLSIWTSYLQKPNSLLTVNPVMIERMSSLLAAETAVRVRSISDAQKLIDVIDLMIKNQSFLSQCGPDARRKAAHLASEILARVPLLPTSFLNRPTHYVDPSPLATGYNPELVCQSVFISKILDHDYIIPLLGAYDEKEKRIRFVRGTVAEKNEPVDEWLTRSSPDLVKRIRVMLEVARTIRYVHSMDVALHSTYIEPRHFFLDSNLRTKFLFFGLFTWWPREASIDGHKISDNCMYESNVFAFGRLFFLVCFLNNVHVLKQYSPVKKDARQLIKRCCAKDPKSRPTMEGVVQEIETWDLT